MSGSLFRSLFTNASTFYKYNSSNLRSLHTATVTYAARKGTRAKARAKKVKVEVTKVGFIPHNQRGKDKKVQSKTPKLADDLHKAIPIDDVYPLKYYRWVVYTAEQAIEAHRQTHHPTMFNEPDALVFAYVELNMQGVKQNRYLDSFTRLSLMPNVFPRDETRTILAFCKGSELIQEAMEAGATTAGGTDIIKKVQEGQLKLFEYDYIIAHPNIITDLVPIRGLMKKKFPNLQNHTLNADLKKTVRMFAGGVQFRVQKDEHQPDFGFAQVPIGRLNMETNHLVENIQALLKDIQSARPKRDGPFITKCLLVSAPSREKLKIDPFVFVDEELAKEVQADSDDEGEAIAATA